MHAPNSLLIKAEFQQLHAYWDVIPPSKHSGNSRETTPKLITETVDMVKNLHFNILVS